VSLLVALAAVVGPAAWLRATDIDGVQAAALDQPRVNVLMRRQPQEKPLSAKAHGGLLEGLLGGGGAGGGDVETFNVQAFLDTGASGILLSSNTADGLGIRRLTATTDAQTTRPTTRQVKVIFHDIGVGGGDEFNVSEPIYAWIAPFTPGTNTQNTADYSQRTDQAFRAQIGPLNLGGGILEQLVLADLDVFGMPAMAGKVVVMDPRPVNGFDDTMRTYVYEPGTPYRAAREKSDPGIPATNRHVKLTYVSFAPFTSTTPQGAAGPTMGANPVIGPDPTQRVDAAAGARAPAGVVVVHNGKQSAGSWLLDTGAAASMISTKQAEALGVTYVAGTQAAGAPVLKGVPVEKQFTLTIGGIGGQKKSAGFYLDQLRVPTIEGDPLVYRHAPVLVADITVEDPATKRKITLDGVFGVNFLVASAHVTEGLLPDIGNLAPGAFEWIVFDEPKGILGVQLTGAVAPKPARPH
jgi:hypothetical protein